MKKTKPFFVDGKKYYQLTVIPADDYSSKFDRIIVFSDREIPSYYSIKLDFIDSFIDIIDRKMPVRIINNYAVAIRPVELEDIATILCINKVNTSTKEYRLMMDYLTKTGVSLTEIIDYFSQNSAKENSLDPSGFKRVSLGGAAVTKIELFIFRNLLESICVRILDKS